MCYNHIQIEVSVIIKSGGLKMKKILALIMVVIVCVSLCACGNKKDKSNICRAARKGCKAYNSYWKYKIDK